jgi:hypothetical protein
MMHGNEQTQAAWRGLFMDNLARLPPALNFMHELLGDRNKQYREAFWLTSHSDVEHLYHYITEAMPGEVLRGVQVQYATEQLKAYYKGSEQLADLLEQHFGTRKFDLLSTDELDAYVEDLIKEGQVTVEPEFFKDTDGKDYRILIKIKNKDENYSSSMGINQ